LRIEWNDKFVCQFHDWKLEQPIAKAAGFKTDGPPQWVWSTHKIKPVIKLVKNKPASGLAMSKQAFQKYTELKQEHDRNEALRKQMKEARKAAADQSDDPSISGMCTLVIPAKGYIDRTDISVVPSLVERQIITPMQFTGWCLVCGDELAFYEHYDICLWCSKEAYGFGYANFQVVPGLREVHRA